MAQLKLTCIPTKSLIATVQGQVGDWILQECCKCQLKFTLLTLIQASNICWTFFFILRSIIRNINLSGLDELNTIFACVLYKGHGKSREETHHTISTCPLIVKALDLYVRDLCLNEWNNVQAPSQFQGPHMSHDLASLLLTETVNFSLNVLKKPVFALFLDARSAFYRVLNKILLGQTIIALFT